MMNFLRNFLTLNVNGIRLDAKVELLKSLLREYDVDIAFLQEVNVDFLPNLFGYTIICNPGDADRGMAIFYVIQFFLIR